MLDTKEIELLNAELNEHKVNITLIINNADSFTELKEAINGINQLFNED